MPMEPGTRIGRDERGLTRLERIAYGLLLQDRDWTVSELAADLERSLQQTYGILQSLVDKGWIEHVDRGEYRPTVPL